VGDAVLTGSDDWTARVWTLNDGECEATIICHAAPVTAVEYVTASRGIITGESTPLSIWIVSALVGAASQEPLSKLSLMPLFMWCPPGTRADAMLLSLACVFVLQGRLTTPFDYGTAGMVSGRPACLPACLTLWCTTVHRFLHRTL